MNYNCSYSNLYNNVESYIFIAIMNQAKPQQNKKPVKVKLKPIKDSNYQFTHFQALSYQKTDTIKLSQLEGKKLPIQTDLKFIKSVDNICSRKIDVLNDLMKSKSNIITEEQCQQIHFKAKLHSQANTINHNSHKTQHTIEVEQGLNSLLCKCGCGRFKGKTFPICYDLQEINILGSGIILFFLLMKYITINILLLALIYSIYALVINYMGTNVSVVNNISSCVNSYCFFRDLTSLYNRNNSEMLTKILTYVGLFGMLIWGFMVRISLEYGRFKNKAIDKNLTSASDYALKINNLPYQQYNQEEFLEYLEKIAKKAEIKRIEKQKQNLQTKDVSKDSQDYQEEDQEESQEQGGEVENRNVLDKLIDGLIQNDYNFISQIKSIQIIYNMEFSRKMILKIEELSTQVHKSLKKKQEKYFIQDKEKYLEIKNQLIQTYQVFADLRKKFLNDSNFRKKISTRTAIIEFRSKKGKNTLLRQYSTNKITIFKALKQKMKACIFGQAGTELIFKGQIPQIMRAPQPSDIIWQNCQKKESVLRILVIYIATFVIILVSFGIIAALEYFKKQYLNVNNSSNSQTNENTSESTLNTILNIVTSIVLQIVNKVLWFSMFYLLDLQHNHTFTSKIVSQMGKTLFAMCINIIILPIIVNYGFGKSLYGASGLAGIVFDYHISAVTINLIMQLINPVFVIIKFCLFLKCIRDKIIKLLYHKQSVEDDLNNQTYLKKVYSLYEGMEFNIAQSYIFITTNIFHAVFFCELQPFILILLLLQSFLFYWISKIKVLKFCKIPLLLELLIFQSATYQLMLVPVFYGTGGIFISYVRSSQDPSHQFQYIAFAISIAIGLLNFFNPANVMQKLVKFLFKIMACLRPSQVIAFTRKTSNEKKESQIALFKQKLVKQKRQENYFQESNSITLLGFQKKLLGELNFKQIEEQLKTYCQSHLNCKKLFEPEENSANHDQPSFFEKSHQVFK